jgi:CheY-like chemotaxis protein
VLSKFNIEDFGERLSEVRKLRFLIVDDQILNIEGAKIQLDSCGINVDIQVHVAYNGEEAVQLVKNQDPRLMYHSILMDCNMPIKDGY